MSANHFGIDFSYTEFSNGEKRYDSSRARHHRAPLEHCQSSSVDKEVIPGTLFGTVANPR